MWVQLNNGSGNGKDQTFQSMMIADSHIEAPVRPQEKNGHDIRGGAAERKGRGLSPIVMAQMKKLKEEDRNKEADKGPSAEESRREPKQEQQRQRTQSGPILAFQSGVRRAEASARGSYRDMDEKELQK